MHKDNLSLSYTPLEPKELFKEVKLFENQFNMFLSRCGYYPDTKVHISNRLLIDLIIRTDKRKAYFNCFHNMKINELKTVSLYAYWILKLRPFTIIDERYKNKRDTMCVNEAFALYLIYCIVYHCEKIKFTKPSKKEFYHKLLYTFHYRNISIDSMLVLVESLCSDTFEKKFCPDQIEKWSS